MDKKVKLQLNKLNKTDYPLADICRDILSWYGGMGSVNDLYICKENGFELSNIDESEINNKIQLYL